MFFGCWLSLWLSLVCCCFCLCKPWFLSKKTVKIRENLLQKNALVLESYFGRLLGALGPLLGTSWASLGHPWGLLGRLLAASDAPKTAQKSAGVRIDAPKTAPKSAGVRIVLAPHLIWAALGPCLGHLGFNLAIFVDFSSFWGPPRMLFWYTFGKRVPCKDSWYTFLGCALDLLGIGHQARGTNRLDPPGVRRSPRSGLQ